MKKSLKLGARLSYFVLGAFCLSLSAKKWYVRIALSLINAHVFINAPAIFPNTMFLWIT